LKKRTAAALVIVLLMLAVIPPSAFAETGNSQDVPTANEILQEASGGKYRPISPDEVPGIINEKAVKLVRVLNALAVPVSTVLFVIGCILLLIGMVGGSKGTRAWGSGTMVASILILALIRLAPIIIAAVDGIIR